MATIVKKTGVKKVKKTATPDAPAQTAAPAITGEPKAKKAKADKTPKPSKYRGVTTNMRVMEYQDYTFQQNVKAMLTDEELAANWHAEFPQAVNFTVAHVGGARRDYNNGTHAKMTPRPDKPLAKVIMDGGKRRFVTDEESAEEKAARVAAKVAKTKETKAAKAPAPTPAPPKAKVRKATAAQASA